MDEKERSRALGATLSQIEKQFGKGSIIRLGAQTVQAVPTISTGSISVDGRARNRRLSARDASLKFLVGVIG